MECLNQLSVLVDTLRLFGKSNNDDLRVHIAVVLQQLDICFMHLIVGRFVPKVCHHRLEVGYIHVQVFDGLLVVHQALRSRKFSL